VIVQLWERDTFGIPVKLFVLFLARHLRSLRLGGDNQNLNLNMKYRKDRRL